MTISTTHETNCPTAVMVFCFFFMLASLGLFERQRLVCLLWCRCISRNMIPKHRNSNVLKRIQNAVTTLTKIAADKKVVPAVGVGGSRSLKKDKIISGASEAVSIVEPTANIEVRHKVMPQTQLTNLFAPMSMTVV